MPRIKFESKTINRTLPDGTTIKDWWKLGKEVEGGYSSLISREISENIAGRETFTKLNFRDEGMFARRQTSYLGNNVEICGGNVPYGTGKNCTQIISDSLKKGTTTISMGERFSSDFLSYAADGSTYEKQFRGKYILRENGQLLQLKNGEISINARSLQRDLSELSAKDRRDVLKIFAEQTQAAETKAAGAVQEAATVAATSGTAVAATQTANAAQEVVSKGVSSASKWKTIGKWAGLAVVGGLAAYGAYKLGEYLANKFKGNNQS